MQIICKNMQKFVIFCNNLSNRHYKNPDFAFAYTRVRVRMCARVYRLFAHPHKTRPSHDVRVAMKKDEFPATNRRQMYKMIF